jgi:signal transduction histidine kinase
MALKILKRTSLSVPTKVTLLVFVIVVAVITAVVWKTQALLVDDKMSFLNDSAMKQMAPLKRLVQERMNENKSDLVRFATARAALGAGRARSFGDFDLIALVQPTENGQDNGQWTSKWVDKSPNAKIERWPQGQELTLLKSLPYAKVHDGETYWSRVSDRQGQPIYAVMISVEIQNPQKADGKETLSLPDMPDETLTAPAGTGRKAVLVGLAGDAPLASVSEDFIGSTNSVYLVDDRGYVVSHVNKAYLGALFSEDPIVKEIAKTHKSAASGRFEDLESRPILGHYEKVDHSNLYAVITTPMATATGIVETHLHTALVTGGAVGLLGLLMAWLVGRSFTQPVVFTGRAGRSDDEQLSGMAGGRNDAQKLESIPHDEKTPALGVAKADEPALVQEQNVVSENFARGFLDALVEPLNSVLGHAQLARTKATETEVRSHMESIERDVRRARDVLSKMKVWKSEEPATDSAAAKEEDLSDLAEVTRSVLSSMEAELASAGIEVIQDLTSVPDVRGSREQIQLVLSHLLENAKEAMKDQPTKTLRVELAQQDSGTCLSITDNGVGMSREVIERAFDPFFKAFNSAQRMGLGLSVVKTTLKRLGADCEIQSKPGGGATFTLRFPVSVEAKQIFSRSEMQKLKENIGTQFPRREPPAGASVIDEPTPSQVPEATLSLDDDDDDDAFQSVLIGRAAPAPTAPAQQTQVNETATSASASASTSSDKPTDKSFRVRIRRPKLNG